MARKSKYFLTRLCFLAICCVTVLLFKTISYKSPSNDPVKSSKLIETTDHRQSPSKWSYEYTDLQCDALYAYKHQFTSFTASKVDFWLKLNHSAIETIRGIIKDQVQRIGWEIPPVKGRGIVYSVYPKGLRMVYISIKMARYFGCKLPIELWHNDELSEMEVTQLETMEGVTVKNLVHYSKDRLIAPAGSRFFSMKGAALLYTDFDEVLLLDVDNVPAQDPTRLFETDAFKETGALFWKDYWVTRCDNPIYKILELDCLCEQEQESGQMLVKKSRFGVHTALSLAFYMQRNPDLYFKFVHGDKDTFRLSWRYLKLPYHMVRPYPGVAGPRDYINEVCALTIVQHFPTWVSTQYGPPPSNYTENGLEVMFYHMNNKKDAPHPELPFTASYNFPVSTDGSSAFGIVNGSTCMKLVKNMDGTRLHIQTKPTNPIFLEKYSEFYSQFFLLSSLFGA